MTSPQFGPTGVVFSIVDRSHPTVNPATPGMQTTTRHGCGSQSGGDGRPRGGLAARWWPVIRVAGWSAGWWPAAAGWVGFGADAAAVAVGCEVAAVGEAVQGPAAFVAGGVVPGTREGSVVDGGRAAAGGPDEVVPVGPAGRSVAPRPGAAVAVAGDHRPALRGGEESAVGAGRGDRAVGAEQRGGQLAVAGQPLRGGGRDAADARQDRAGRPGRHRPVGRGLLAAACAVVADALGLVVGGRACGRRGRGWRRRW